MSPKKKEVSPGSIGGKIKKIRNIPMHNGKSMRQKDLALKCGFSKEQNPKKSKGDSGTTKIGYYETNRKTPRPNTLQKIADALGVPKSVFFDSDTDLSKENYLIHALFDMEDFWDLHPEIGDDKKPKLVFGKPDFDDFLIEWNIRRAKSKKDAPTKVAQEDQENKYDAWRYSYKFKKDEKKEPRDLDSKLSSADKKVLK